MTSVTLASGAVNSSADLALKVNGTTKALSFNTSGALGVGSTPSYGTSGQVLTSAGTGAAPTWATASSGGGLTLLGIVTAAGVNSVTVTSLPSSKQILIVGGAALSTSDQVRVTLSVNNGSSFGTEHTFTSLSTSSTGRCNIYNTTYVAGTTKIFISECSGVSYREDGEGNTTVNNGTVNCIKLFAYNPTTLMNSGTKFYIYGMN